MLLRLFFRLTCDYKNIYNNKIIYCIVNLLNLRNIPIQVRKLYIHSKMLLFEKKQNLNFKGKLLELLSVFFLQLSSENNK